MQHSFFSLQALAEFVKVQNKDVEKVICNLFLNNVNKDQPLEIIDNIQIFFTDKSSITIGTNEDVTGLDVISFKSNEAEKLIPAEYSRNIRFFAVDASATSMWKDVIGKKLLFVKLTRQGEHYKNDSVILDFGEEKREITMAPLDGIIIDLYED
jgi:hypothetical protein